VAGQFRELTVRIRHTGDVQYKLEQAKLMLARAGEMFGAFSKVANELAERQVSKDAFGELVEELFPLEDEASPTMKTRTENNRNLLAAAIKEEIKLLPPPSEGFSYWTLLNGITRFADHKREVRPGSRPVAEARFESNMVGNNAWFKQRAAARIIEMAEVK
jgi:hypothetical protein